MKTEKPRKNLVSFSGGKDSTALILWAKENLTEFDTVFFDTGWEHQITYDYVDYIDNTLLNGNLIRLKSKKYDGFADMCIKRGRVPSVKRRFCTQELKLFPLYDYIHNNISDFLVYNYVGIRAAESKKRAAMPEKNFDLDYLGCWIIRPLLKWTADDVFNILKAHNIKPNPLYKMGMKRVGCMPCIMSSLRELKTIGENLPGTIDKISQLEKKIGRSFFAPEKIPNRFHSARDKKTGFTYPLVDDVFKYVMDDSNQLKLDFAKEPLSCMSYYNICE